MEINKVMQSALFNGDYIDILNKEVSNNSIDLILTDPPYAKTKCEWDNKIDLNKMWKELKRVGKENCAYIFTASQPFTTDLINSNRDWFRYELIWIKNSSADFLLANKRPMKYHENILVFYNKQPTYNPQKIVSESDSMKKRFGKKGLCRASKNGNNVQEFNKLSEGFIDANSIHPKSYLSYPLKVDKNERLHPSQKPVELFEWLIKSYSNRESTVLDPFAGSGTTVIAATNTGRHCIAIEKDNKYYEIIYQRLQRLPIILF